jgi:hypothetical protein
MTESINSIKDETVNRIRIKSERDECVHFCFYNAATLCGLETIGDLNIGIEAGSPTDDKVDCPDCISTVDFCRSLKSNTWRKL